MSRVVNRRIRLFLVILTLAITLAVWSFARILESDRKASLPWAAVFYASIACGVLLKGLIGIVFPAAIGGIYLILTGNVKHLLRMRLISSTLVLLLLAAPWHIAAAIRNPAAGEARGQC